MGTVIKFPDEKYVECLFRDYVAKAEKAHKSLDYRDASIAADAWLAFLDAYGLNRGKKSE